ncbi:MAG: hypothetical protein HYV63_30775 [Candidatus Schekmanbacteria bacterium]|nr:hypothetical protein [Candidatus Schekmanbacteria bacterium]
MGRRPGIGISLMAGIASLLALGWPVPSPADTGAGGVAAECATAGKDVKLRGGDAVTVRCPAGCGEQRVWGTEVYTDDSAICAAAIHAGVLASQGGDVHVVAAAGRASYTGTVANGVSSEAWGPWGTSFTFAALRREIACDHPGKALEGGPGTAIRVTCPRGCVTGALWGTGIYTDDSAICLAAAHAGVSSPAFGGEITVTILPGQSTYAGSQQNGVTSEPWESWDRSFSVSSDEVVLGCEQTGKTLAGAEGKSYLAVCPADCDLSRAWGTDMYTDDSSVCTAALHAGAISAHGGALTVVIAGPGEQFPGSERNGVRTESWGAWERSFSVAGR